MKRYYRAIIFLIFIIIIVSFILIYAKYFDEKVFLTLFGDEEITLYQNDEYIEYGYIAFNDDGDNIKERVIIKSDLNTSRVGKYKIEYIIKTKIKTYRRERIINVILDTLSEIDFHLKGSSIINLNVGDSYNDSKFICINKETKEDLTRYVVTESNVNLSKPGEYEIIYRLRYNGKEKVLIRKVYIFEQVNSYKISTFKMTNKPVSIEFKSNIYNFSHIICPNETIKYENLFTYNFYENGDYTFYVFDTLNNYHEYVIKIKNIDKIAPTGTCEAILDNGTTTYKVKTNDSDIVNYLYNNDNKYISKDKNYVSPIYHRDAKVLLMDEAGNKTLIKCEISKVVKEPIDYVKETDIKYNASSDSLKISIMEKDGYFLTHIWSSDPYIQAKKEMLNEDSENLLLPKKILEQALDKYNLYDKIIWSSNASGIVLKGTYYKDLAKNYPFYNLKEPSSLLVYNGNIIINDYEDYAANTFIYYINANNQLTYIPPLKNKTSKERKEIFEEALLSGINNTFAFNDVLVHNGQVQKVTNDYYALRNGFCQLDENNFLSVVSDTRRWNKDDFAEFMKNLGCVTAVNFDGGGSNALFFKEKNNKNIKTLTGNSRAMSSIIYFSEL